MRKLVLDPQELSAVDALARRSLDRYGAADDPDFLVDAAAIAGALPTRIRHFLNRYRRQESGVCVINGHPVDDARIGPTPEHWAHPGDPARTELFDARLVLYSALLGEVCGWATQQDGRVINNLVPIRGNEHKQLGSASEAPLEWHTEDAIYPHRADFFVLACLRNPGGVATTVADMADLGLKPDDVQVLFEPRFVFRPDEAQLLGGGPTPTGAAPYGSFHRSPPAAVLYGAPERPYVRADRHFCVPVEGDGRAAEALQAFVRAVDGRLREISLAPGDHCFVDNQTVVHGRKPFTARYDGTDRWLKRVSIIRDVRRSREARAGLLSHVVH